MSQFAMDMSYDELLKDPEYVRLLRLMLDRASQVFREGAARIEKQLRKPRAPRGGRGKSRRR